VYVIAGLALLHFFWSQKADRARPLQFLAVFAVLLGVRVVYSWLKRRRAAAQG
jgi:DMSO/TMAO reductase YedYZ heme-binding membrane subunit